LPQTAGPFGSLIFSRDGNYIYYVLDKGDGQSGQLFQVPTLGGQSRKVAGGIISPISFSPDGGTSNGLGQFPVVTTGSVPRPRLPIVPGSSTRKNPN
jgi:hypothetical protein